MSSTLLPPSPADAPRRAPGPEEAGRPPLNPVSLVITGLLVLGPIVAIGVFLPLTWGHAVHLSDLVMALVLYVISGYGVTVGFHRMLTHSSFRAKRPLKIALIVAGSLAVEGTPTGWVAAHRCHHVFSDAPGDPHSPHRYDGDGRPLTALRGFLWAHVGWLFLGTPSSAERYAPDLVGDRDVAMVSRLFPLLAVISLALPFGLGWALSGTLAGAFTAFVWAGLIRMGALHHMTWSVNSICHMIGRRPFVTKDLSTNVAALSILSLGESWHNLHHAYPTSARHGALRGQLDPSARLIRIFERFGWVTKVRWPSAERLALLRS